MTLRALYELPAPAKLNLFLHVVGRRADGYHLLQSVFVLIDWATRCTSSAATTARCARHDLGAALPADDLCLRAARALQAASGCALGADISIDKRVPGRRRHGRRQLRRRHHAAGAEPAVGPGLAARRGWPALALTLGADVPFFVGGRNAFVEGIGERLTPIDAAAAVASRCVKPAAALATAADLRQPDSRRATPPLLYSPAFLQTPRLAAAMLRLRSQRPAAARRRLHAPRWRQAARLAAGPLRQQPHDGFGQRGVRESRRGRVEPPGDAGWRTA